MLAVEQARDLVDHFGSRRAVARAVGADESTVRYWLNPEPKRARVNGRYDRLSGYEYNRLLMLRRRCKALTRRQQRHEREALANG